jgi:hypothetical protein
MWIRESTDDQDEKEIAPEIQIGGCRETLKKNGFPYEDNDIKMFRVAISSTLLWKCKEFQELKGMIQRREVLAFTAFNRSRLESNPFKRAPFIGELQKAKIPILFAEGNAPIDGMTGGMMETMDAYGKWNSVMAARSGATQGLAKRVQGTKTNPPRPTSYNSPGFGLTWGQPPSDLIIKNDDYDNAVALFELKKAGYYPKKIRTALYAKGILPPNYQKTHNPWWSESSIRYVLKNPVYAGRYYALRSETVRKNEYGEDDPEVEPKTKRHDESYGTYMSNIKVRDPIITWEEHLDILESFPKAKHFAQRNAKEPYLLQGMIYGEDGHVFIGRRDHIDDPVWRYTSYDEHFSVHGNKIEAAVKAKVREIFAGTDQSFWQRFVRLDKVNLPKLQKELVEKKKKRQKIVAAQTNLVKNLASVSPKDFDPEAIKGATASLNTELAMMDKHIADLENQIAEADAVAEKVSSFLSIKKRFADVLNGNDNARWRELLIALDCHIVVYHSGGERVTTSINHKEMLFISDHELIEIEKPPVWKENSDIFVTDVLPFNRMIMVLRGGRKVQPEKIIAISEPLIENNAPSPAAPDGRMPAAFPR